MSDERKIVVELSRGAAAGSAWVLYCYAHRLYRPAGWVTSFSWRKGQRVLPVQDSWTPLSYREPRSLPPEMRIRAATARTDSKIQKGANGQRDQPGQRLAPASQAPGPRGDEPVVAAAAGRWKEPEVDCGLLGESGLRSGDPPDIPQLDKSLGCCARVRGKVKFRPVPPPADTSAQWSISLRRERDFVRRGY